MTFIAPKGFVIRDDNGVEVATVTRDIQRGDVLHTGDINFADGRRVYSGELIPPVVLRALGKA